MNKAPSKPAQKFVPFGWTTLLIIGIVIGSLKVTVLADARSQGYPGSFAKLADKSSVSVVNIIAVKVIREAPQGTTSYGLQDPIFLDWKHQKVPFFGNGLLWTGTN